MHQPSPVVTTYPAIGLALLTNPYGDTALATPASTKMAARIMLTFC